MIAGIAWEGPGGAILWGWPDDEGRVLLRQGSDRAEVCSVLPPALSLALAFRRSGAEPGTRALVIGDGFAARYARAVASTVGCRVRWLPAGRQEDTDPKGRPDVVVEASGGPQNLAWGIQRCRDWGTIYSVGGALASVPLDYYTQVHRRALTVTHVPELPVLRAEEEEIVERGAAALMIALRGITPESEEVWEATVQPEGARGRLSRERSGWGLLRVDGP
jgi:threonine dehydrogenase-like Zn-dependent dehydrogenase